MLVSALRGPSFLLASTLLVGGCSSIPTFESVHDAGFVCSADVPCGSGQSCLQGHCYATCDATHPCSGRETCTAGVCVASNTDAGMPPRDAGMDGGPCAALMCSGTTSLCRGDVARCVTCTSDNRDACGGATAVCDVGRGSCTTFGTTLCAPCNGNADCPPSMTCVHRTAPGPEERVCLPSCASGACTDPGFSCGPGMVCQPFVTSCTAYRAALAHLPCTMDSDCPQLGATFDTGLVTNMCGMDSAGAMVCRSACGLSTDCPTGMTCGSDHFCL